MPGKGICETWKKKKLASYLKGPEITIGDIPQLSLGYELCWVMDWQWEEQGEK